jgi:hypothetical protein
MNSSWMLQSHRRLINALVDGNGLRYREVDWDEYGEVKERHGEVVMPHFDPTMTEEELDNWMDMLITKTYQRNKNNRSDLDYIPEGDGLKSIHSLVCDQNTKLSQHRRLIGADEYSARAAEKRYESVLGDTNISPQARALNALDASVRASNSMVNGGVAGSLVNSLDGEAKTLYDKLMDGVFDEMVEQRESGIDNFNLANKIASILNVQQEEPPQGGEGESDADQSGDGEDQQGSQEKQRGDDASAQAQEAEGEGEEEQDGDSESQKIKPMTDLGDGYSSYEVGINKEMDFSAYDLSKQIIPWDVHVISTAGHEQSGSGGRYQSIRKVMPQALSAKVRNILKVMSQARYVGGHKRGKINKRVISSVVSGNERIFRQKEVKDVLDTSVLLVVDSSGSMHGSRYTHACAAAASMVECLKKLNINHAVYGFSTGHAGCVVYEHKKFNESGVDSDTIIRRMTSHKVDMNGNADAEALIYTVDKLIKQKQKRKIMIVLSDGQPAGGSNPHEFLKLTCRDIERNSPCELYGVGIESDCVQHFYSNNKVLNKPSQLEATLLNLFKDAIIK